MRTLLCFFAAAALSTHTTTRVQPEPMFASVVSTDSTQRPTINVEMEGALFQSLGVIGTTGTVWLTGNRGTVTGVVRAELTAKPGELTFSVSPSDPELELRVWPISGAATPRFEARGRTVVVGRSASGEFYVKSGGR